MLDQMTVMIALEGAQQTFSSIGASVVAAFSLVGAAWRPEQTKALMARSISRKAHRVVEPVSGLPDQVPMAVQFDKAAGVVETSLVRGSEVERLQASALEKLDAVEYSLHRLMDELSSVMPQIEKPVYAGMINKPMAVSPSETALAA